MKSRIWVFTLLTALAGCGGGSSGTDAGTPQGDTGMPGTDSGVPGSDTGVPGSDTGVPGNDTGVPGSDAGVPGSDTGTAPGAFHCTTGSLFSGFPNFDSEVGDHAREGDPLAGVQGRPLGWRELAFVGTHIATIVGKEVWSTDRSAASPVVHRIAGLDSADQALVAGPCNTARFANLQDIEATSDGNLFVMDQTGNAVLRITHPFDAATCTVEFWAGTSVNTPDISPPRPPNVGNMNGPGVSAQFSLPGRMAIDPAGNLYVWDQYNTSLRKIANDASHTVTTFAPFTSGTHGVIVDGMVVMGSSLYVYAHDTNGEVFIDALALTTGAMTELLRGRADLFDFSSTESLDAGGLTTDGVDLLVYFKGGLFSITTAGVITRVAGDENLRSTIEFDSGYDPMVSHPALQVQLANRQQHSTAGANSWLAFDGAGHLYFVGNVSDPYVERFDCSR